MKATTAIGWAYVAVQEAQNEIDFHIRSMPLNSARRAEERAWNEFTRLARQLGKDLGFDAPPAQGEI